MGKTKKPKTTVPAGKTAAPVREDRDEIDFRTVVWALVILAVLVVLHRLVWGG